MFTPSEGNPVVNPRKQSADAVHLAMTRFPLVIEILGELGKASIPLPGDSDIQHGCKRALTAMLLELSRIEPAPLGKPGQNENIARNWLHTRTAAQWMDPDQLERFQHFIDRILGPKTQHN